ncbi:hypothetical protein [Salinigranum rubrum]|uniref:hypothetical protein n=1 Tax=Salinigranum rubrum TaxID=755307 RepID=UPI0013A56075|nr:hypothetical protein [Salinigranum rubrum]
MERLARLFREPAAADGVHDRHAADVTDQPDSTDSTGPTDSTGSTDPADAYRGDGGSEGGASTATRSRAVAVVVQAPPAGVRRYELTVRADAPVESVDPGLLTRLFETFDEGRGVVRARAVDVDGRGAEIEATPLFTVRFAEPVDTETVSVDGTLTGHDEEPVPWSRVRLTPVE